MQKVPVVIFGATVCGIAAATIKSDKIIIIEKSMLLGSEFISSMNIKSCKTPFESELALAFSEDLKKRGLLSENGEFHIFPVSGLLADYLRKSGSSVLLMTDVVSIESCSEGFKVKIYNTDGFSEIFSEKIIDTTSEGLFLKNRYDLAPRKSICAMLLCDSGRDICGYNDEEALILKGKFTNEYVLKVKISSNTDWPEAREILHNYWEKQRHTIFAGWKIASVASAFSYDFKEEVSVEVQKGWLWKPSASYADLLSAYEGGVKCAATL